MDVIVSVVIPTHNRAQLLKRAILSACKQTFRNLEIIVIDDASQDDTKALVQELADKDQRIKLLVNETPLGGSQSRNKGINLAKGKWIAFLDDDDVWLPKKLEWQLKMLSMYSNAIACSSAYLIKYPFGIKKYTSTPTNISLSKLLESNSLGGASVCLASAQVLKNINGFDSKLRSSQDWDVWVRLRQSGEIVSINKPLVEYQVHFSYRISNDMRAKYMGARHFYFKHKPLMSHHARKINLCFICFIQSRQQHRPLFARAKKLLIAISHSPLRVAIAYTISSFPRIMLEWCKRSRPNQERPSTG